jgi:UDP-N-acetylglucosamine 2-epimerase (non-hydrolysing)
MELLAVIGTRPEAVKMAPIILALQATPGVKIKICVTGQHQALLDQALDFFSIQADFDLNIMAPAQTLNPLLARLVDRIDAVLAEAKPDRVIVQGDTTSALAAALAAFHRGIPVAHVEAGLRTYRRAAPFPEEMNRRAIALVADLHFAPTRAAGDNLLAERLDGDVFITGNSGIDALERVLDRLESDAGLAREIAAALPPHLVGRRRILVTAHRRESFGAPFRDICDAIVRIAALPDTEILFPLHPNPQLQAAAQQALGGRKRIRLLPALDLPCFVRLLSDADLVLTDSGGVQEEGVALGKTVLVLRDVTERPEGVQAGAARLIGTDADAIVNAVECALARPDTPGRSQLYGDGRASERIVDALLGRQVEEFARDWPRIEGLRQIG